MTFIIIMAIMIYFILIAWTWQSLSSIEKTKKVIFILVSIAFMYGITFIIFQVAQNGIAYGKVEMKKQIQTVLVSVFTGINGIIVIPQIAKMLDKINEDEMKKEQLIRKSIVLIIIFILCAIFELGYMKDTQEGILKIYDVKTSRE